MKGDKTKKVFTGDMSGYLCPACGTAATTVISSMSISDCVMRTRKCLICGFKHQTSEVAIGKNITYFMGLNAGRVNVKEVA